MQDSKTQLFGYI